MHAGRRLRYGVTGFGLLVTTALAGGLVVQRRDASGQVPPCGYEGYTATRYHGYDVPVSDAHADAFRAADRLALADRDGHRHAVAPPVDRGPCRPSVRPVAASASRPCAARPAAALPHQRALPRDRARAMSTAAPPAGSASRAARAATCSSARPRARSRPGRARSSIRLDARTRRALRGVRQRAAHRPHQHPRRGRQPRDAQPHAQTVTDPAALVVTACIAAGRDPRSRCAASRALPSG